MPFDAAFQQAFRDTFRRLDDRSSARVIRTLFERPASIREEMQAVLKGSTLANALSVSDALKVVRL